MVFFVILTCHLEYIYKLQEIICGVPRNYLYEYCCLFSSVLSNGINCSVYFGYYEVKRFRGRQREWVYWKRRPIWTWKIFAWKLWNVCFCFIYIKMNLWNKISVVVCDERHTTHLTFYFPCSTWFYALWNQNGGSYLEAAYRVAIVTCCWF